MKQVYAEETERILRIAQDALGVDGDLVELGCYEGDTSLLLAELLKNHKSSKKLWIYDSFEGLPEKSVEDESAAGIDFCRGELSASKREVKARFLRANLPVPVIKKAWFQDLTDEDLPSEIGFAFLDGDLYESIKASLELVEDKMAEGGVIIIHDYENEQLPGVTKAVDEFLIGGRWKMERYRTLAILRS